MDEGPDRRRRCRPWYICQRFSQVSPVEDALGGKSRERSVKASLSTIRLVCAAVALLAMLCVGVAQEKPPGTTQAARPMRTEAEARARAEANRQQREQLRLKTGAPAELISDYVKANIGPVPESLGRESLL
jgi:hypothetical protein